jgi:hypothetical protein
MRPRLYWMRPACCRVCALTADELRHLLICAAQHSPRSPARVWLVTFGGLRSPRLSTPIRDGRDHGHRVLKVNRKGGKTARREDATAVEDGHGRCAFHR